MSTAARRLDVLRAIVIEHVGTNEPVASKAVAQSHVTGVSSATIRNDMSALEDQGLIRQPHTSAGRIPTEAGYRVFVDSLGQATSLGPRGKRILTEHLADVASLEDAADASARALAGITGQAALVEYPDVLADRIRRVELVDLDERRLLVLVVTTAGKVLEQVVTSSGAGELAGTALTRVREQLNRTLQGVDAGKAAATLQEVREESQTTFDDEEENALYDLTCQAVQESLRALETKRIVTAGAANLARAGVDLSDVATVLDVLEDRCALTELLKDLRGEDLHVSIGTENPHAALSGVSLVSTTYAATPPSPSHLGVIGPTRMDYARSLAAVEAVSRYLSRLLLTQSGASGEVTGEHQETGEETE